MAQYAVQCLPTFVRLHTGLNSESKLVAVLADCTSLHCQLGKSSWQSRMFFFCIQCPWNPTLKTIKRNLYNMSLHVLLFDVICKHHWF